MCVNSEKKSIAYYVWKLSIFMEFEYLIIEGLFEEKKRKKKESSHIFLGEFKSIDNQTQFFGFWERP